MLSKFQSMWNGHREQVNMAKLDNEFTSENTHPTLSVPQQARPRARDFEKVEIDKKLAQKVNKPVQTKWAAPNAFTPKKDESLRFGVDYRRLNVIHKRNSYPQPCMDEYIDSLVEAAVFSALDTNSRQRQVVDEETYRDKTAVTSHHILYRFVRMPLGQKNTPVTFQRAADAILSPAKWQLAIVCLDDTVVFSSSPHDHVNHVKQNLSLL